MMFGSNGRGETKDGRRFAKRSRALASALAEYSNSDANDSTELCTALSEYCSFLDTRGRGEPLRPGASAEVHDTMLAQWPLEATSGTGVDSALRRCIGAINALFARTHVRYDRATRPRYYEEWRQDLTDRDQDVRSEADHVRYHLWPRIAGRPEGAPAGAWPIDVGRREDFALSLLLLRVIARAYRRLGFEISNVTGAFEAAFDVDAPLPVADFVPLACRAYAPEPLPEIGFDKQTLLFWAANEPFALHAFTAWGWLELRDFGPDRALDGAGAVEEMLLQAWRCPTASTGTASFESDVLVNPDPDAAVALHPRADLSVFLVGERDTGKTGLLLGVARRLFDGSHRSASDGIIRNIGTQFRAAFDAYGSGATDGSKPPCLGRVEIEVQHPIPLAAFAQRVSVLDYPGHEIEAVDQMPVANTLPPAESPFDAHRPEPEPRPEGPIGDQLRRAAPDTVAALARSDGLAFVIDGTRFAVEDEAKFDRLACGKQLQWYANILSAYRAVNRQAWHIPIAVVITHADRFLHGAGAWRDDLRLIGSPEDVDREKIWDAANDNPALAFEELRTAVEERLVNSAQRARQRVARRLFECGRNLIMGIQSQTFRYEFFLCGTSDDLVRPYGALEAMEWLAGGVYDLWTRDLRRLTVETRQTAREAHSGVEQLVRTADAARTAVRALDGEEVRAAEEVRRLDAERRAKREELIGEDGTLDGVRLEATWWERRRELLEEANRRSGILGMSTEQQRKILEGLRVDVAEHLGLNDEAAKFLAVESEVLTRWTKYRARIDQLDSLESQGIPEDLRAGRLREHRALLEAQADEAMQALARSLELERRPDEPDTDERILRRGRSRVIQLEAFLARIDELEFALSRVLADRGLALPEED